MITHSYNVYVANALGIKSAVFLSYLWSKMPESADEDICMTREEIQYSTGMSEDEQVSVEKSLSTNNIISVVPFKGNTSKNHYHYNDNAFNAVVDIDTSIVSICSKEKEVKPRKTARQIAVQSLKSAITVDNPLLNQYLCDWIDAVYANPKNNLTKQGVQFCINDLLKYSTNDDIRIEVVKLAIKRCLRDLNWAIEAYDKETYAKNVQLMSFGNPKNMQRPEKLPTGYGAF